MKACPRCGSAVETYRTVCDCGHDWSQQPTYDPQLPSSHGHTEERHKRPRTWPWIIGVVLLGLGGWHIVCTERVEAHIFQAVEPFLVEQDPEFTISFSVHVQPLSNFVAIEFQIEAEGADPMEEGDKLIVDTVLAYLRNQIEPAIERELSLVARRQFDLYAMVLPYRSAISLDFVANGQ